MDSTILNQLDPKALGQRLQEARKARGFTQQQIAEKIGVARTTVIAIEKGERRIAASELLALCQEYGRSPSDFVRSAPGHESFLPQFRMVRGKEEEMEDALLAAAQELELHARNYLDLERMLSQPLPKNYPAPLDLDRIISDVEQAAEDLAVRERNRLGFGDGPVTNLRARLESEVGLRIFCFAMEPKVAGLFGYSDELGGCIALNASHPAERRRWSLAHEYGHFLATRYRADISYLSHSGGKSVAERFVDHFAKLFLMPTSGLNRTFSEMRQAGQTITLASICTLASHFEVSFQALVLRLEELRRIKAGTWEMLIAQRFRVGDAKRSLGLEQSTSKEVCFSERYQSLALLAYEQGLLTEDELSEKLRQPRVLVREFVNAYRRRLFEEDDGSFQQLNLPLSTEVA